RAWREALRWTTPADLDRACDPGRSAHSHPRRGDLEPRFRVRGADPGRLAVSYARADDVRDRAAPLDDTPGVPDPGGRAGEDRGPGERRRAAGGAGPLLRALHQTARGRVEPVPGPRRGGHGTGFGDGEEGSRGADGRRDDAGKSVTGRE